MANMPTSEIRRLKLWQGRIETEVEIAGHGPPLVYLHGPWGLAPDRAFIARLAESHTVHAPKFPGTSKGDTEAAHHLDDWHDLLVCYGELFDTLGLETPSLVGHSFGGLLAAEIAALAPKSVRRLVLIDPVGLWLDEHPVQNWMLLPYKARPAALFADPEGEAAKRFFETPADAGGARRDAGAIQLVAGLHRQVRLADRRSRPRQSHSPHRGADACHLGRQGWRSSRRFMRMNSPNGSPARALKKFSAPATAASRAAGRRA